MARFSAYSISPQDQQIPVESKPATNRIVYASAAAHSFIMPPMATSSKSSEATWYVSSPVCESIQRRGKAKSIDVQDSINESTSFKCNRIDAV